MTLFHYIGAQWDYQGRTGISRFDGYLRQVFPEMVTVDMVPLLDASQDVVITDNHLSLRVPMWVPAVVVHHGCSRTVHLQEVREQGYYLPESEAMHAQDMMFVLPNRTYVAPSPWVRNEFMQHYDLPGDYATVIPHWVPLIDRPSKPVSDKPIVMGDWRDEQKGKYIVESLKGLCAEVDFRPLRFSTEEEKLAQYREADYFLCLSLSEGFCYAMADAEAACLPIISTAVGCAEMFAHFHIPLAERSDISLLAKKLRDIVFDKNPGRWTKSRFYETYTFSEWSSQWHAVVEKAGQGVPALK